MHLSLIHIYGTLTLYVPAAAAEIITGTENERVIRAVLRDSFGIEDELFICSDSAISMPSSKRPKLGGVQAQRKNKAPVKTGEKEVIFGRAIKSRPISMYDVRAVSYTHLDVYKRQRLWNAFLIKNVLLKTSLLACRYFCIRFRSLCS